MILLRLVRQQQVESKLRKAAVGHDRQFERVEEMRRQLANQLRKPRRGGIELQHDPIARREYAREKARDAEQRERRRQGDADHPDRLIFDMIAARASEQPARLLDRKSTRLNSSH